MENYEKALELVKKTGADAVLVSDLANIRYLSGYTNDTGYLLITEKNRYLLTDFRFITQARAEAKNYEVIETRSYAKVLAELIAKEELSVLAFEEENLSYSVYRTFSEAFGCRMLPIANILATLRRVKTAEELVLMKEAEHIGDRALKMLLPELKPGITEGSVAAKLEYYMRSLGAEAVSFPSIVASGLNSAIPHAMPGEKKLETGDFITMDFGCKYHGYCSDMTRTVVLGKANEKQKEIYNIVLEAQLTCLELMKPGSICKDVHNRAVEVISKYGYGQYFGHGLGHSVGLEIHENPACNARCEAVLEPGIVMTDEPGIYIEGFGGVRIEDMLVITENGYENFAESPKELIEL